MGTLLISMGISFAVGMFLSGVLHIYFAKQKILEESYLSSIMAITFSSIISITAISLILWNTDDFVGEISRQQYLIPLCMSLIIIAVTILGSTISTLITIALICAFNTYYTDITIIFNDSIPMWSNMFLTALCWWLFSCGFYCISGLSPEPQSQAITPALGMVFLTLLGMAPLVLGTTAAALTGILLIAYIRSADQPINQYCAPVLGYIIGWLGLMSYPEYLLPCFAIFAMYYFTEASLAILRKITTLKKYQTIPYNTTLYQAYIEKAPAQIISSIIWMTDIMLIILGIFQVNGDNAFSLPVFAMILCVWQQYRTINWQKPNQTLKETNQEVIKSIKTTFSSLFKKNDDNQPTDDK